MRGAPRPPSFLVDPLVLGAVLLLVVNDRWLKPMLHDGLTGKLSDLALCAFLPAFFAELVLLAAPRSSPRRALAGGAVVAAVLFAGLELVPSLAEGACAALAVVGPRLGLDGPFGMTRDPTDLWALPVILLAVRHGERRCSRHQAGEVNHAAA